VESLLSELAAPSGQSVDRGRGGADRDDSFLGNKGVLRRRVALDNSCSPRTVQPSSRPFERPGVEKWDGEIYLDSSQIQLTSHAFPPSDEKDCSIRDDFGEMLSQT
jgi:hypothetical protein